MKGSVMCSSLAMWLATVSPVFAASGAREDNSGFFVWAFIGICALIIIAQVIPAVMVMMGFAKGVEKEKEKATAVSSH